MMAMDSRGQGVGHRVGVLERKASAEWMKASMPELAVTEGGQVRVRTGSTMATFGRRLLEATTFLTLISLSRRDGVLGHLGPVPPWSGR
jgi:hypothetical protein